MFNILSIALTSLTITSFLAGCNQDNFVQKSSNLIQVSNLTQEEVVPLDNKMDWKDESKYMLELKKVSIVNSQGVSVSVTNLSEPLFFSAYWCPHCQRTLVSFDKNKSIIHDEPIVISTGFPPGTTLKQAVEATNREFHDLGVSGFKTYYCLSGISSSLVPIFPTIMFHNHDTIHVLVGEHTSSVWNKAFKDQG
ncbi:hypothetical protein [Alicyclobacillus acidoterrestris]|uniref:hypothetical protein n=1 Tax=Alicyclobacillus acidoterrestris TaxID=1450 RepID=UPI0013774ED8|nr:hypothetical protein [Alicyclobacillus acidoterrestris]